jgi:uncharacterized protein YgiM (DUF1202 family)
MKRQVAALFFLIATLGAGVSAEADKTVKLSASAPLRARPGERAPTITKLSAGQSVKIVAEKGRWLQVSVGGRVGWITRTQAELDSETEIVSSGKRGGEKAPGGKRGKKKWDALADGSVGGDVVAATADEEVEAQKPQQRFTETSEDVSAERPELEVGETVAARRDATVRKKPSKKGAELFEMEKGDRATVLLLDEEGAWVRIEDEEGTKGWVAAKDLEAAKPAKAKVVAKAEAPAEEEVEETREEREPPRKSKKKAVEPEPEDGEEIAGASADDVPGRFRGKRFTWFLGASMGFLSRTQRFTSEGTGVRANYGINNSAPAVQAGGQAILRFGKIGVGVEGWYLRSLGGSGIQVDDGETMGTIDYRSVAMDARLLFGVELAGIFMHARGGYHRDTTYVTFNDFAMLPDERVSGFTAGAGVAANGIARRLGLHAEVDVLLAGKLSQDAGTRDGTVTKSVAYYISGGASFQLLKGLEANAAYSLTLAGFGFAGPSDRDSTATDGRRKDRQHLVTVGARYSF